FTGFAFASSSGNVVTDLDSGTGIAGETEGADVIVSGADRAAALSARSTGAGSWGGASSSVDVIRNFGGAGATRLAGLLARARGRDSGLGASVTGSSGVTRGTGSVGAATTLGVCTTGAAMLSSGALTGRGANRCLR